MEEVITPAFYLFINFTRGQAILPRVHNEFKAGEM